ncbi:hypothetical protein [Paraburkholderia caffeinilytica]|uniref:hypothetical protein n=1 Tax=Paraburkholderia caffeinilytica TaxID=1761016 RepID=UPI0038BD15E8
MMEKAGAKVVKGGGEAGQFDGECNDVRQATGARCAAVVIIEGDAGSGYSVVGPLDAQVLLPDILEQIASTLRGQLFKNLQ